MSRSRQRKRMTAANSFTQRDVSALLELHRCVLRGGDARHVAASPGVVNVIRKFQAMEQKQRAFADAQKGAVLA